MSRSEEMTDREVLDQIAKDAYKELRDIFPGQGTKWRHLDGEDRDYYRHVAAAVIHGVVDQMLYMNGDHVQFTVREFADAIEKTAAAV